MLHINDKTVASSLDYRELVEALRSAFLVGASVPLRQQHAIDVPGKSTGHLILMPAWQSGKKLGIKIVNVFPDNDGRDISTVNSSYLLMDANTGLIEVILDGNELTRRRTAAASALAAGYLARSDSRKLLMVGTGNLAEHLIRAHCAVHPIETVDVWGRNAEHAKNLARKFVDCTYTVRPVSELEFAVSSADIISCATMAMEPLVMGNWLVPGQHLDLVGSFTVEMREADDVALKIADIYVDTREGALAESGEIVQGIEAGIISESDIKADLYDLCSGKSSGRTRDDSITLFKSVGCALEDLVAAELVLKTVRGASHHL